MRGKQTERAVSTTAETEDDRFTSYEDEGGLVVCDRKNPNAWIRCDVTSTIET